MKKRTLTIIISLAVVVCFIAAVTGTSLAIWKEVKSKDIGIGIEPETNPSLRFQVFAPLDSSGNLIGFEPYNSSLHGSFAWSSMTDKGFYLYYYDGEAYNNANSYQIEESNSFYVRDKLIEFDESKHGKRQYSTLTTDGYNIFYKAGEEQYKQCKKILLGSDDSLYVYIGDGEDDSYVQISKDNNESLFIYTQVGEELAYTPLSTDNLVVSDKTTKGLRIFYFDSDAYVPATAEQIINGENLWAYVYAEYIKNSAESIELYGNIVIDNKTSKGNFLYIKDGRDYVSTIPSSLSDTTTMYVGKEISSYALVGYTGLVAELKVPSVYTDKSGKEFSVTRICSSNDYADVSFENNPIITSIVIPASIEYIADATFANLSNLNAVYFTGNGQIRLGKYCFMACKKLETVYIGNGEENNVKLVDASGNDISVSSENNAFLGCTSLK